MNTRSLRPKGEPRGIVPIALLIAAAVFLAVGLPGGEQASAATTTLVPVSQGSSSGWTPNVGGDEVAAVNEGSCSGADGDWITGGYQLSSSYYLDLSGLPAGSLMQSVQLSVCYRDDNSADDMQTITPFLISYSEGQQNGTAINPKGSTTLATSVQNFAISDYSTSGGLQIGVKDFGFLAQSRVRVYAMWAVVTYEPPGPTVLTMSLSDIGLQGGSGPYGPGEQFVWTASLIVSGSKLSQASEFNATWDPTQLRLSTVEIHDPFVNTFTSCSSNKNAGTYHCYLPSGAAVGTHPTQFFMEPVGGACKTTMTVSLTVGAEVKASASDEVELNGGCSTPTPTPTADPTPTASATSSPSSTSVPTSTATSGTPTGTSTVTATSTATSSATTGQLSPSPTATATASASATPTSPPSGWKFQLRMTHLARDGTY